MTELEKLKSYLDAQLTDAEREMIALRTRIEVLVIVRGMVESAIDREKP